MKPRGLGLSSAQREMMVAVVRNRGVLARTCVSYGKLNRERRLRKSAWSAGERGFSAVVGDRLENLGLIQKVCKAHLRHTPVVTKDGMGILYRLSPDAIPMAVELARQDAKMFCSDDGESEMPGLDHLLATGQSSLSN